MAEQPRSGRSAVLSVAGRRVSSRTASSWNQNGTGRSSGEAGTLPYLFPTSKLHCFVWKGGQTFLSTYRAAGMFHKSDPCCPGRGVQWAPFFPVQNVFLDKVRVQLCSVSAPQLCSAQGTLWWPNTGSNWPCEKTHHLFNLRNFPSIRVTRSDPSLRALEGPRSCLQPIHPSSDFGSGSPAASLVHKINAIGTLFLTFLLFWATLPPLQTSLRVPRSSVIRLHNLSSQKSLAAYNPQKQEMTHLGKSVNYCLKMIQNNRQFLSVYSSMILQSL